VVDFVGQSSYLGEFKWGRLFTPGPLVLGESAYERTEAGFMVFIVEPCPVPSTKRHLHGKFEEVARGYAPNNLLVCNTQPIFQEKVIVEQRKIGRNFEKGFRKMDEDGDPRNGVRIEMD
jgi:hypothetical protein